MHPSMNQPERLTFEHFDTLLNNENTFINLSHHKKTKTQQHLIEARNHFAQLCRNQYSKACVEQINRVIREYCRINQEIDVVVQNTEALLAELRAQSPANADVEEVVLIERAVRDQVNAGDFSSVETIQQLETQYEILGRISHQMTQLFREFTDRYEFIESTLKITHRDLKRVLGNSSAYGLHDVVKTVRTQMIDVILFARQQQKTSVERILRIKQLFTLSDSKSNLDDIELSPDTDLSVSFDSSLSGSESSCDSLEALTSSTASSSGSSAALFHPPKRNRAEPPVDYRSGNSMEP